MADSQLADADVAEVAGEGHSLATYGMAVRVKYRRVDTEGKPLKKKIGLGSLSLHPKNRGGLYPSWLRCKALAVDVVGVVGFLKEGLKHAAVRWRSLQRLSSAIVVQTM